MSPPPLPMLLPLTAELIVEAYLAGVRIDSFLIRHFRNYTPYRMQRLVRAGQVRIEGALANEDDRVYKGQRVQVRLIEPPDHLLPAEPLPLDIIYEDPWLVVVNKPPNIVAHPCGNYARGSLANALQAHFDSQTGVRGLVRPGIVHRLDRLTSGVIVCTREHLAHRRLSIGFQTGKVSKSYLAIVHGVVEQDRGDINLRIGQAAAGNTIVMSTAPDALDSKAARTLYEVVERFPRHTLVMCHPVTGRLHQIRVHMAGIGHPIVADEFYSSSQRFGWVDIERDELPAALVAGAVRGSFPSTRPARAIRTELADEGRAEQGGVEQEAEEESDERVLDGGQTNGATSPAESSDLLIARQALHACRLTFFHPIRRETVTFEAPLPADMSRTLDALRQTSASRL